MQFKIFNKRTTTVFLLAFSSGLPIALTSSTLQAWYTTAGVDIHTIGLLTLVGLPYLYKFLWSPILDKFTPFKILGKRRSWVLLMQICLIVALFTMSFMHPVTHPMVLAVAAMMVAFFSATQDIGIDAYRTDVLSTKERGIGATFNTIGYRFALIFSSGIAMILASQFGWRLTYSMMALLLGLEVIVTFCAPCPEREVETTFTWKEVIVGPVKEFLSRKYAILLLLFIIIYKFSDALALSLNTNFLLHGMGFTLLQVGSISKVMGVIAALVGSLVGGLALSKMRLWKALLYFGALQVISNLTFMWLALVGKDVSLMAFSIFAENFCGGLSTVAFVAFLMGLCDKRFTATQYAFFSAAASLGRVLLGPLAAMLVSSFGWAEFYFWTFILGWPALLLLLWLKERVDFQYLLF